MRCVAVVNSVRTRLETNVRREPQRKDLGTLDASPHGGVVRHMHPQFIPHNIEHAHELALVTMTLKLSLQARPLTELRSDAATARAIGHPVFMAIEPESVGGEEMLTYKYESYDTSTDMLSHLSAAMAAGQRVRLSNSPCLPPRAPRAPRPSKSTTPWAEVVSILTGRYNYAPRMEVLTQVHVFSQEPLTPSGSPP